MAPADTIARLVALGSRGPGMEGERRAAELLEGELRRSGREVEVEPTVVRPAYHLTHALHAALAVVGSVLAVDTPIAGVLILLAVSASMFGDLTGRFHLLRLITPRRRSQNLTSRGGRADAPARLVLVAHYDAARSGFMFARRARPRRRLFRRLARLAGPIDLAFWAAIAILVVAVVRLLGNITDDDSVLLTVVQFVPTVLLIAAVILFVDVALSDVVPGASDNASGVAAVIEVARRLHSDPPEHLDVWVVLTGAKEGLMLGMRRWMREHADELDPRRTFFVNVDTVGAGRVRFVNAEGFVILYQHDARLVELCRSTALELKRDGTDDGERVAAEPYLWRLGTDGVIAVMRGFSAITICCTDRDDRVPNFHRHTDTPDRIDPEAVETAIDFVEQVVRRIDRELVPALTPSLARAEP